MKGRIIFRVVVAALAGVAGLAVPVHAQTNIMPFPDALAKQLAARASDYSEVTLDRKMLDFAGNFMNGKNDADGKRIIAKLKGIYVRSYEFDKPGQYTEADLAAIRRFFAGPEWSALVKERSKHESDDVYMKLVNGQIMGMVVLDAEPRELDFVYIDGPIRPQDLSEISGHFGIPSSAASAAKSQNGGHQ